MAAKFYTLAMFRVFFDHPPTDQEFRDKMAEVAAAYPTLHLVWDDETYPVTPEVRDLEASASEKG